jgi:hypothetical protein
VVGQIAAATRYYYIAQDEYKRLQEHKFAADVSSDVETREKGERFVILQPAQPPSSPDSPKRLLIDLLAVAAGIPIALFVVLALEVVDGSVKTAQEIGERLRVPVLGEIPWLDTSAGTRRQRRRGLLAVVGNAVLAVGYCAFLALALR